MNFNKLGTWLKLLVAVVALAVAPRASAQWLTQTNVLPPGWSAVYLYVDPSGVPNVIPAATGLPLSFGNPIDQIWLWKYPASSAQYINNPLSPLSGGGQWLTWQLNPTNSANTLVNLVPNSAYLVHNSAASNYTWTVKGQPVAPSYSWDLTGLNFIGFPTPVVNPPSFQKYFAQAPAFASVAQYFAYTGGPFSILNPQQVFSPFITPVMRGQAYWVSATNVNNTYFGPFKITLPAVSGIAFGANAGQQTLHLINVTTNTLTIYAQLRPSETPPAGQASIAGPPPLLVEGALNSSNLTYGYTALDGGVVTSWTLPPYGHPGCDIPVVIGVNRFALTNAAGAFYAGFLRFTDSLGFSDVAVPVSAVSANNAGLWVGSASISQVGSYMKTYATNLDGSYVFTTTTNYFGAQAVVTTNSSYLVTGLNTNLGAVPTAFPLRLIVFNDGTNATLLQRVYYGIRQDTNVVVATTESVLDAAHLNQARRISCSSLPWTAGNTVWPFAGQLLLGATLTTTVTEPYDDQAANPFLHTYHPDHNNLDLNQIPPQELPQGSQSFGLTRGITLTVAPNTADFITLTTANSSLTGYYQETTTLSGLGGATRTFTSAGTFKLVQISPIATLTTQ